MNISLRKASALQNGINFRQWKVVRAGNRGEQNGGLPFDLPVDMDGGDAIRVAVIPAKGEVQKGCS